MTKTQALTQIGQRLGDTSTAFLAVLSPIFDEVLRELALHDAIRALRKTATFTLVADQRDYDTATICGIPTDGGVAQYPIDLMRLTVFSWGLGLGELDRVTENEFMRYRLASTDDAGVPVSGRPVRWTLYPNETNLQVDPVASADYAVACEVEYIAPPATLADGDDITELRLEYVPVLLAGCIKYGAVFKNETATDMNAAMNDFAVGIVRMKTQRDRRRGMEYRTDYRDF